MIGKNITLYCSVKNKVFIHISHRKKLAYIRVMLLYPSPENYLKCHSLQFKSIIEIFPIFVNNIIKILKKRS